MSIDGWATTRIGQFAHEPTEHAPAGAEVLSVTKHRGFVPSLEYFGKQVFSKDTANYKLVRRGQFAYATIHLDEGSIDCLMDRDVGIISPMYTVFDVDDARVDRRFLLELLRTPAMLARYAAIGQGSINRRKSIGFDSLAREAVELPPLPEQKKIATILSSVDEAIQATQAVIDQTRRIKEGLLQDLLTRGIGHTRFKQTEIGEIPEGWDLATVGDVTLESAFGPRFSSDRYDESGNFASMRTTDIDADWVVNYSGMPRAKLPEPDFREHVLQDGDLLVTRSGTCGVAVLFNQKRAILPVIPAAFLIRFRLNRLRVRPAFILALFQGVRVQRALGSLMAGGVQKNLSGTNIKTIRIPIPPLQEQDRLVAILAESDRTREAHAASFARLSGVKAGLLADLLTGKVRVTT